MRRLVLPFLILLAFGTAADAKRMGYDLEVYDPPFARSDPAVAAILKAYDAERDDEVERLSRRLLEAREVKDAAPLARVEALFLLGRAVQDQHRPSEAESDYRAALALLKPLIGAKDRQAATARQWAYYLEYHLGLTLTEQGRLLEARQLQSILPLATAQAATVSGVTFRGASGLPAIKISPCPGAAPSRRVLSDAEQGQRDAWDSAAIGALRKRQFDVAEKALREKLAFDRAAFDEAHCEVAVDKVMLAETLFRLQSDAEAERLAREALATFDASAQPPRARSVVLALLAGIVASRRGAAEAEPFLRRLVEAQERSGSADAAVRARVDLAANLYAQGRAAEAEALYRQVLDSGLGWGQERGDLALDIRVFLGFLAERRGDYPAAIAEYRAACTARGEYAAQSVRGGRATLLPTDEATQAGSCALRRTLALRRWAEAGGGAVAGDRPEALLAEAFEAAQTALPSPSGDALARSSARIAAARSGQAALAEQFEEALRRRDAAVGPRPASWDDWEEPDTSALSREERERLDREIADLATRLAASDPFYWDLRSPRPLGLTALQGLLKDDEALAFFLAPPGPGRGLVFIVSRKSAAWAPLGESGDGLRGKVAALRRGIDSRAYGISDDGEPVGEFLKPFDRNLAYDLYRSLFGAAEIQAALKPVHTLIVVPTGPLTSLPPGLLVTARPSGSDDDPGALRSTAWLLRDKAVALLPSVASLRTLRQLLAANHGEAVDPLIAFADPDFGGRPGPANSEDAKRGYSGYYRNGEPNLPALKRLPRLEHTAEEARALAVALDAPREDVLTGRDASRRELMIRSTDGRLAKARVIEFATHGLVGGGGDGMTEPALVLASGATARDWLLTASDAATLRINADWVLLSACNTASPDGGGAEGLSGLVRGFFHAGASALLVSHWSVQDEAASRLIPRTLLLQRDGKIGRAEALRRASLELLDTPGGDFAHPFFWAPFTLIGDPR